MKQSIILASSSSARAAIMDKLPITYTIAHPDLDETPNPNETAAMLVHRLSLAKALAIAEKYNNAFIIAADQVAQVDNIILGKPLTMARATEQLTLQQNKKVTYYSGLCLLNTLTGQAQRVIDETHIKFRKLTPEEIQRYLTLDNPLNCAGSFKCESLGMLLVEWVHGDDIFALQGLSMVSLARLLKNEGISVLE